jgi:glutathione S-transferase
MASTNEIIVGYWPIRGRAGVLRNLLTYVGLPYKNHLYNPAEWFGKDKQELGFDYPNLPYIIDGDKKITESSALLYYIPIRAGKRELIGDTDDKFIQVQVALNVVEDARSEVSHLCWTKGDFKAEKEKAFSEGKLKTKLEIFNKKLEGKEWLTGFLSIADFVLFETLDWVLAIDPASLDAYPNLKTYHQRFLELPSVKAHRESESFVKLWLPPNMATWSGAEPADVVVEKKEAATS